MDLVITCTNVSAHQNKYFSVGHSPNFPVVDAVLASMSLPFFFKPLLVNTNVEFDEEEGDDDYTRSYRGLYVDGGMTRNYPLHAFDNCKPFKRRASMLEVSFRFSSKARWCQAVWTSWRCVVAYTTRYRNFREPRLGSGSVMPSPTNMIGTGISISEAVLSFPTTSKICWQR
ncbi:MAG: patatin-like phospholipase family protein [Flavobacteriales bacterium]|nr:patatin-like phospholipase family protein [Flavobacteriales bacterium]